MSIPLPEPRWKWVLDQGPDAWVMEQMLAYGAACRKDERERIASWLDAEHEKRKHIDNHAAYYARAIRDMK